MWPYCSDLYSANIMLWLEAITKDTPPKILILLTNICTFESSSMSRKIYDRVYLFAVPLNYFRVIRVLRMIKSAFSSVYFLRYAVLKLKTELLFPFWIDDSIRFGIAVLSCKLSDNKTLIRTGPRFFGVYFIELVSVIIYTFST